MAGRADIKAGAAYVELYVRNNHFTRGLRTARRNLDDFAAGLTTVGRQLTLMSAGMMVVFGASVKTFASFDDSMRAVKAITQESNEQFAKLTNTAKLLGRTTSFTAIEVAELMTELGRAGFSGQQIDQMTGSVLNLARATGTEAATSAGIMAASIRQFGLDAGEAERVADGLTAAANKSFNTVEMLGDALTYAGPVARDFNLSFEDTLAILGGLGNVGIQSSMAGTALRRLLTLTGADAEKLQSIFGVAFVDASGNARPLVDVLSEVNDATKDLGSGERAKKFKDAFGLLGITGASAIGRSAGDVRELADEIKAAGGIADETAEAMDSGLGGAIRIALSAAEGLKIALGEAMEEGGSEFLEVGASLLGIVTELIEKNKDLVVTIVKVGAVIGILGVSLLAVGFAVNLVSVGIGGLLTLVSLGASLLGGLVAVLTSPFTLAALAIAGVTAAVIYFTDSLGFLMKAGGRLWTQFKEVFGRIKQTAGDTFQGIKDALSAGDLQLAGQIAMTGLKIAFMQGLDGLAKIFGDTFGDMLGTFATQILGGNFAGAWNSAVALMSTVWETFSAGVVKAFAGASKKVVQLWRSTVNEVTNYLLQKAGEGGILGKFLESVSGVNVKEELERHAELESKKGVFKKVIRETIDEIDQDLELARATGDEKQIAELEKERAQQQKNLDDFEAGGAIPDIFDKIANGTYEGTNVTAIATKMESMLSELEAKADQRAKAAGKVFDNKFGGGKEGLAKEIADLQAELTALLEKSKKRADDAAKKRKAGEDDEAGGLAAAGAGAKGGFKGSFASFSAAALIASSQGVQAPVVKAIDKAADKQVQAQKQVEVAVRDLRMHHP